MALDTQLQERYLLKEMYLSAIGNTQKQLQWLLVEQAANQGSFTNASTFPPEASKIDSIPYHQLVFDLPARLFVSTSNPASFTFSDSSSSGDGSESNADKESIVFGFTNSSKGDSDSPESSSSQEGSSLESRSEGSEPAQGDHAEQDESCEQQLMDQQSDEDLDVTPCQICHASKAACTCGGLAPPSKRQKERHVTEDLISGPCTTILYESGPIGDDNYVVIKCTCCKYKFNSVKQCSGGVGRDMLCNCQHSITAHGVGDAPVKSGAGETSEAATKQIEFQTGMLGFIVNKFLMVMLGVLSFLCLLHSQQTQAQSMRAGRKGNAHQVKRLENIWARPRVGKRLFR